MSNQQCDVFVLFCFVFQSTVTLDDVFTFLVHFRPDESLCRGSVLWNEVSQRRLHVSPQQKSFSHCLLVVLSLQLCTWLSDNEGGFKPSTADASNKETVLTYVQSEILLFLRVAASTGMCDVMMA